LEAEFDAPLHHVLSLIVEFDLTTTWNAFMKVGLSPMPSPTHVQLFIVGLCILNNTDRLCRRDSIPGS